MSFSSEIFNKKLSGLSETQDSIVTISQWILFHHRHSKDSARYWSEYILNLSSSTSSSSKKLSLLYLCNDVVQQARHKRKPEFIRNFAEVLPNVFNKVYKTVSDSVKPKVTRLIDVWEQRSVFTRDEIKSMKRAVELSKNNKNIEDYDDAEGTGSGKSGSNNSSSGGADIAPELAHLNDSLVHLNTLNSSNQSILQQMTIQSKTYLPSDPSASDNLPSPKIYISKLNILEKFCNLATTNLSSIKNERQSLLKQLESLTTIVSSGIKSDDAKLELVQTTLAKLKETMSELEEMIEPEEPSPAYDDEPIRKNSKSDISNAEDDDDDMIPTYENSDDEADDDNENKSNSNNHSNSNDSNNNNGNGNNADDDEDDYEPAIKRHKPSRSPSISSGASTPSHKKSVAFSEDIEIKEYEREERTDLIQILKSDDEHSEEEPYNTDDIYNTDEPSEEFEKHHKDDLELKHEHDAESGDEYEPSAPDNDTQNDVLSILSKLG
ncbi:regulator of Ty1 transposition protein 103 [[Candida] railenensis]|uniref:Regulator of Ty1 transposition protein 103 n=1 Tax=[Candida] railenensis TaxID=45579 RepID=A0A9P0QQS8_9ASCO|nr:regulator of Ty1 transposition protein 103 [[Candida] railenensis]